ncbi:GntR family transcriptional regulator [Roseomonas sp. HJA6]|uniref:GntR family transcriptional regulator n=1 Tax=Roseomonas alba TaxID=2846776 RepID=A0ABS7AAA1_9PROT|nr:GntR family transcriptional regulator [Neoroseomonas alba]MBW6399098.1 GntR family transcriptional regulator [Neoroseomonas alba]
MRDKKPLIPSSGVRDLARDAYDRVKAAIQDGELTVGTRVTEAELANLFGISRTPIRDAIVRLEADGLLTNEPRRGLVVTQLDHQQMVELYAMREILEGAAAQLAARHASEIEVATLESLVEEEGRSLGDRTRIAQINWRFHELLSLAAHNRYLLRSLRQLSVTMSLLPSLLHARNRAEEAHHEHRAIVMALRARDGAAAEVAIRAHIQSSQRHRVAMMLEDGTPTGAAGGR